MRSRCIGDNGGTLPCGIPGRSGRTCGMVLLPTVHYKRSVWPAPRNWVFPRC